MALAFGSPWILLLLWLVPALGLWWAAVARAQARRLDRFVSGAMRQRLGYAGAPRRSAWQAGLVLAALALMVVAAARPCWGEREQLVYRRGRDLVIALDVSRSMLANDVYPNRLGRARVDLIDLIDQLDGDRAALIAFRQKAILLCPLTTDYAYLKTALDAAGPDAAPRGETDIGDAIRKALDAFDNQEPSHKAIVLISDGEDLSGNALAAADEAAGRGIPIFTVGLGDDQGARIPGQDEPGGYVRFEGEPVVTRLNNETLNAIAARTGGAYVPVGTAGTGSTTLGDLYRRHLSRLLEQDLEESMATRLVERYQWFLAPALLLLLAAAGLSRGRLAGAAREARPAPAGLKNLSSPSRPLRDISGRAPAALLAAACLASSGRAQTTGAVPLGPVSAPAALTNAALTNGVTDAGGTNGPSVPPGRAGARLAQALYRQGRYADAAAAYEQAAAGATRDSQRDFRFNAALSWIQAGDTARASAILRGLVHAGGATDIRAARALGAAQAAAAEAAAPATDAAGTAQHETLMRQAAGAFQEALRTDAQDADTRRNLGILLERLPEAGQRALTARLLEEHAQTPLDRLLDTVLESQRRLADTIPGAFTNATPAQVPLLETLSARQEENANLWIPLKPKLAAETQGRLPPDQAASLDSLIESIRADMQAAAGALRDLDPAAYPAATRARDNTYALWRELADYQDLLREDIRRQSNALDRVAAALPSGAAPPPEAADDQQEAAGLTERFLQRLPPPLPDDAARMTPAPGTPGTPPTDPTASGMTADVRSNIVDLAQETMATQQAADRSLRAGDSAAALEDQRHALDLLHEIESLIPRAKDPQPQDDQQQDKNDKQDQQQDQQSQQQDQQQDQEQDDQQQQEQEQQQEPQEQSEQMSPEQAERLFQEAAQREQEYEDLKRRQNRLIPLPPHARDW